MKNNSLTTNEIRGKIKKGLDLTYKRLIKSKSQSNGVLVISDNGRIKKIRVLDLAK